MLGGSKPYAAIRTDETECGGPGLPTGPPAEWRRLDRSFKKEVGVVNE